MRKDRSPARGQHYVPLVLQNAFASPGKGKLRQVHVFDKHEGRSFRTAPENILHVRDFNTFEGDGGVFCLEGGMGAIEGAAAPALCKVREQRSLAALADDERAAIIVFAALQKVRGVNLRTDMVCMVEQMRERLRANGDDPDRVPQLQGHDDQEAVKLSALNLVSQNLGLFAKSFADKVMVLFEAAPGQSFLLGDNPVVLANHNDTGPYGNLGLDVVGIEIYLPISPSLALAFWCPTIVEMLREALARCEQSLARTTAVALLGVGEEVQHMRATRAELTQKAAKLRADLAAIEAQTPLEQSAENIDYVNALQVGWAERYLISATGDFALAKRMIADNARYRRGRRPELA